MVSPTRPARSSGQRVPPSPAPRSATTRGGERSAVFRRSGGIHSVRKYRECSRSSTDGPLAAKGLPSSQVAFGIDEMPVALDVPVLATDDEQHEIFGVACVRDGPPGRRLDVQQPALTELVNLAADLDARAAAMHEVELVLSVVPMMETREAGRHDDRVYAERRHAERTSHLPEAVVVAELLEGGERVPAHSLRTISSASARVNARSVSVCSAP